MAAWVTEVMMRMKLLNVMGVELLFMKVRKFVTTFYACVYFIIIFCLFSVYAYLTNVMYVDALLFSQGCYGVSDTASVSSTVSSCSTEPWFCEACRAGVTNPTCELCPNSGNIIVLYEMWGSSSHFT